jgi:hypothetical protein
MNPRTACLVAAAALVACSLSVHAGVVEAEYFVGPDPGAGQGIALTVASSTNAVATDVESTSIDLAGLAPGTHDVGVRAKDSEGRWSTPLIRRITVYPSSFSVPEPEPVASNSGNGIVAAEYFVGPDPGAGSGTTVEVSAEGASAAVDAARPLANTTSPGVHDIGLRVKDGAGRWSSPFIRRTRVLSGDLVLATLSNLPPENSVPPQPPLQQTFLVGAADVIVPTEVVRIGADGAGVELAPGPSESAGEFMARLAEAINSNEILAHIITASTNEAGLRVTAEQPGLHPVSWLETSTNLAIVIEQEGTVGSEGRRIVSAEYFVGEEPEPGTGTPFEFVGTNSSAGTWEVLAAPTAGITSGTSKVGIRFKNAAGQWGNAVLRGVTMYPSNFTVAPPTTVPNVATNRLIAAEYFVGSDPGPGRATDLGLVEDGLTAAADTVNPLTGAATPGTFTVGLRFKDSAGRWGNPLLRRTTVQPAAAVANTLANLPPGNTIPPEPASPQVHRIDLAGAFRCGQTFSVTIGGETLEVPARPFETAANFLQRLVQAINSDPVTAALVEASPAGNAAILLTAQDDGWRPDDWVETSAGLRGSLVSRGSLGSEGRKIIAAEYFVGLTPDPGTGTPVPLNVTNANAADFGETSLPIAAYRGGGHAVGVRFKNAAGQWGQPVIKGFTSYVLFGSPDTKAPVITLNGEPAISVPYGSPFTDPGATASDDIDGDLSSALVVRGSVDTSIPGDYQLHYWSEDLAGNRSSLTRTVSVVDDTQPIFEGARDIIHTTPPATVDLFAGLRAVDAQFGDLSYRIKLVSNNVDWFAAGSYNARFEVVDPAGNTAVLERTITLGPDAVFYPGFQTWMADRGALAGADGPQMQPHADPDGDGRSNLQEWQADTDPFNRWSVLAAEFAMTNDGYRLSWPALQRITYTLEQSTDMAAWLPIGDPISYGESCILDAEIPANSTDRRMFYRVKAAPKQPLLELPPQ